MPIAPFRGFNGATAMKPWKRRPGGDACARRSGFNGATAMKPWKSRYSRSCSGDRMLQWGHGDEAVEEASYAELRQAVSRASMGPRR